MTEDVLWLDFETKSRCDLPKRGAYNYALDPSTKPLCLGYAFNDEEFVLWWPHEPFPLRIKEHFRHGRRVYAHNAAFDRLITWYVICPDYDVPEPPLESWYCTAVQSRANCGPSSLEDVGRFAGSKARKNYRGAQLIRALSLPRADGTFDDNPELMHEMGVYCIDDCLVMREVSKSMRPLSDEELHDYHVNERVNDRGVLVDRAFAQSAFRYSTEEIEDVQAIVTEITKGEITSVRSQKLKKWVMDRISPEAIKLMERYEDGEKKFSFDKTVRFNLLAVDDYEHVPAEVVEVIQCADDLWSSSVAKFKRMDELADVEDNRVRGAFAFAGGAATGRAASYGLQVHNFPRKCAEDPLAVRKATIANRSIVPEYGKRVTDVLKGMLRPSLIAPPGKKLIVYDWSGIEARVLPWLSQQPSAEKKLDVFRRNEDLYIREAAGIYHIPEAKIIAGVKEKDQEYVTMRQIGKVAVLALGFQGSVKAFTSMGKNYGVVLPESEVRKIVAGWRRANPWAVQFWQDLELAYMSAMRNPGAEYSAGRITYLYDGEHLWYALPSGRVLCYPYAKLEKGEVTYAKASWKPAADVILWPRAHLYGGLASENCTQATANCLLRRALRECDAEDLFTVLHTHDEIVAEADTGIAEQEAALLKEIMLERPDWAEDLPLAVEGDIMDRYSK
jgi:DNA polymerase